MTKFSSVAMLRLLLLMLPGLLAACGSTPAPRQPLAIEQARAADKDARKALRDGELLRAQHGFAQALALQQSLDDTAGAAHLPRANRLRSSKPGRRTRMRARH